jgi:IrrE N-terminal-like domain
MLIHTQMPGAKYVAPPDRWLKKYRRRIKTGARPLVILQPMGPVMFVFDVSDTEPLDGARPLPAEVEEPFAVRGGTVGKELALTIDNGKRDGVNIIESEAGSQRAGSIQEVSSGRSLKVLKKVKPKMQYVRVPLQYELLLNAKHSPTIKYATLAHELGHLYCGHVGTPNVNWWPERRALNSNVCEFEAESVCYLVCSRLGIDNPSDEYLSGYMDQHQETPPISLDCVMKAAGLIEHMGRERLKPRKN